MRERRGFVLGFARGLRALCGVDISCTTIAWCFAQPVRPYKEPEVMGAAVCGYWHGYV